MSSIRVDYDILNQKQTPAFYASSLATRPAFGFPGRIFIDTDTPSNGIYRDTGSAWIQVADPGAGTTGTLQQVTTNGNTTTQGVVITSGNLAIGTASASAPLDIHEGTLGQLIQLNATSTNNSNIAFLNGNVGKWRIGNVYNAGANDFNIFNIGTTSNALSFNSTTNDSTFIGSLTAKNLNFKTNAQTTKISNIVATGSQGANIFIGNGGDNVSFTSADTGSYNTGVGNITFLDITTGYRNAAFGQAAMSGLTTGYFNVAVGDNAGRFWGGGANLITTANSSIFIGRDSQASANGNTNEIVIGTAIVGNGSNTISLGSSANTKTIMYGKLGIKTIDPYTTFDIRGSAARAIGASTTDFATGTTGSVIWMGLAATTGNTYGRIQVSGTGDTAPQPLSLNTGGGPVLVGTATDDTLNKLQVNGSLKSTTATFTAVPTSSAGLTSGQIYQLAGTLMIVP